MSTRRARAWWIVVALTGAAFGPAQAHAQRVFQLQQNASELGMESRAERWWYDRTRPTQFSMFGEWLALSASGMLVAPGVVSWSGTVRPYIGQQNGTGSANAFDSRNLGLSFAANLLAAFPLSLTLNAHRSSGFVHAGLGGENDFFTSGGGGVLSWRTRALPVTLEVSRRATEDSWTSVSTDVPIRRNEVLHDVRLQAQSSKTQLLLERVNYHDRLGPLSFRSVDGSFDHALRWGTGSLLQTTLQAGERVGSYPYARTAIGWRVLLHQSAYASTDAYWQRRAGRSAGLDAHSLATGGAFRLRSDRGWNSAVSLAWTSTGYRVGGTSNALAAWRTQLTRRLGERVQFSSNVSATYERMQQWLSTESLVEVFDERHTVDERRTVTLANPQVDSTSVEVRNADLTLIFAPGIDYRFVPLGSLLQLQMLPGSRIAAGDVVLVHYRFVPPSGGEHDVAGLAGDVALGNSTIMVRASGTVREATGADGGADARLLSGRDRSVGLTLRHDVSGVRVEVDAQHRRRSASANDFLTNEVRVGLVPRGGVHWQTTLGVRGSSSHMAGQALQLTSADGAVTWTPSPTLRLLLTGERWLWLPSNSPRERYITGALEVDWQFGRIETQWRYGVQRRLAQLDNNQHRLSARVVRRF